MFEFIYSRIQFDRAIQLFLLLWRICEMRLSQEQKVLTPETWNVFLMAHTRFWMREHLGLLSDGVFLFVLLFDHSVVQGILHVALAHALLSARRVLRKIVVLCLSLFRAPWHVPLRV